VLALWILLVMQLMVYALAYSVTPWDLAVLMPMTMDRLLLHAVPAVIFLAGWHWAEIGTSPGRVGSAGISSKIETTAYAQRTG
jgi:hypothetical protein